MAFFDGESMGATAVPLSAPVPAGAHTQTSVGISGPVLPGNFRGAWQLVEPYGNRSGELPAVVIVVSGGTSITATSWRPSQ